MRRVMIVVAATLLAVSALAAAPAVSADSTALAPIECEFSVAGSSATVTWTRAANDNATAFIVRRSRNGGPFGWTGRVAVPGTSFSQTVPGSSDFAYTVEAKDSANQSTDRVSCVDQSGPSVDPVAPISCNAARTGRSVAVTWTRAANDNATAFIVRRSRDGGPFGWTGRVTAPTTSFDQSVSGGSTYEYTVETRDASNSASTATLCTSSGEPPAEPVAPAACLYVREGNTATVTWDRAPDDNAEAFIVRRSRNGGSFGWTGRVLAPATSFVQPSLSSASSYAYRVETRSNDGAFSAATPCLPPQAGGQADRVLHVSIDGLRSDYVDAVNTPTLWQLIGQGASTLNARTDYNATITLPNHTGQLTSRRQRGSDGFNVLFNEDNGGTVHDLAGFYVSSSFDVAHDNGLSTFVLSGKNKFDFFDRSWNEVNGAVDTVGVDDGRDKIDTYVKDFSIQGQTDEILAHLSNSPADYIFWHIPHPDGFGHLHGWASPEYEAAVVNSDASIGAALAVILGDPGLAAETAIVVTSDHGGPSGSTDHGDASLAINYTVPLVVWGPGVAAGGDLYALNPTTRTDPGLGRPDETGTQPIRAAESGNISMQLLGLSPIPGSRFNAAHDLALG